jgi:transcriptional regulator with XRE-family HTH domain
MQKSLKSPEYARLVATLVAVRHASGIRQQVLAKKLRRPQSFISKFEGGERRIDVVEFITIARALGADPVKLFQQFIAEERSRWQGEKARPGRPILVSEAHLFGALNACQYPDLYEAIRAIKLLGIRSTSHLLGALLCPMNEGHQMDRKAIEPAIKMLLAEISSKLDEAGRIAKAAKACAATGATAEGVSLSMDIEQLLYEAGRLGDAASLLNRLSLD